MMQRWSNMMTKPLRTFLRRGALLLLVPVIAVSVSLSPLATRPANAQFSAAGNLFTSGLSSCAIETVGWVICPTMLSIAKLADYGFTYINTEFLKIDFSLSKDSSGTYKAWEIMRNIANGLFVVAFMILIYSQLTGRGGDYNMKRLVPRLIICAILVNLSYFLCSILVEVSNIIGDSLIEALKGTASSIGNGKSVMPIGATAQALQDGTLTTITSEIMSKTAYAWVLLAPTAAVVISVATICAAGIVLLIMRKVIIAMLILASPILFVAYLLPNTERFFVQGSRLFIQLLLLYPIVALLLGAGQIVSVTIVAMGSGDYRVTGDSYSSLNGGSGSAITDLTAAAAAVLPLLGVWFLFKNMNSLMSTAGSRLSAAVTGRRGGKDDKDARVTGKATSGAAATKNTNGVGGTPGRRQAFNRNRRRHSLGGSALTGEGGNGTNTLGADSSRKPAAGDALQDALDNGGRLQPVAGIMAQQPENLEDARLDSDAKNIDAENALAENGQANQDGKQEVEEKDKPKTAKDIFNNLNRGHESKDKDRKFGAGPSGSGDAGSSSGGNTQPTAPATNYQAPTLAQNGNIVTGGAAAPAQIVAVPVQIDGASLLGGQSHDADANTGMTQPPISGTEEKAKARAQKYLFEANGEEGEELDVFGKKKAPEEPPHVDAPSDKKDDD